MLSIKDKKNFYRYTLSENSISTDLSVETFQRRTQKKIQSRATDFIFDLTDVSAKNLNFHLQQIQQLQGDFLLPAVADFEYSLLKNRKYIRIQSILDYQMLQKKNTENCIYLFNPLTKTEAYELVRAAKDNLKNPMEWTFLNYNSKLKKSLTIEDIHYLIKKNNLNTSDLPFWNSDIPAEYELESLQKIDWQLSTLNSENIQLSVIIPTFNNCIFLSNVIQHLIQQTVSKDIYEIIVVDDGSTDTTNETLKALLERFKNQINLKYIYWPKTHPVRGAQNFFRAGLARNCGVEHSDQNSTYLFFLDSDMLVPSDFIETILFEFKTSDILQFSRRHITQTVSKKNPQLMSIHMDKDTYIEEKKYWSQLFESENWADLKNYWKFTCTYALGISKSNFYDCGRFKRHFISYGLEDTDLGFIMSKKNKKFKLIQKPLFHLTNYSTMQYQNSKFLRDQLLRKTAKLFYLSYLNSEIFEVFHFYFQFERSLFRRIKDFF